MVSIGANISLSFMMIPSLLEAPAPLLAKQWKKAYDKGKALAPPISLLASGIFGYLAYRERSTSTTAFSLYTTAAVLGPSIVPYTLIVMGPTNKKLLEKADSLASSTVGDAVAEARAAKEDTVHALADKWASLNLVRAIISLTSSVLAAWATINPIEVVGIETISVVSGANRLR
jgi:hypothetical protein